MSSGIIMTDNMINNEHDVDENWTNAPGQFESMRSTSRRTVDPPKARFTSVGAFSSLINHTGGQWEEFRPYLDDLYAQTARFKATNFETLERGPRDRPLAWSEEDLVVDFELPQAYGRMSVEQWLDFKKQILIDTVGDENFFFPSCDSTAKAVTARAIRVGTLSAWSEVALLDGAVEKFEESRRKLQHIAPQVDWEQPIRSQVGDVDMDAAQLPQLDTPTRKDGLVVPSESPQPLHSAVFLPQPRIQTSLLLGGSTASVAKGKKPNRSHLPQYLSPSYKQDIFRPPGQGDALALPFQGSGIVKSRPVHDTLSSNDGDNQESNGASGRQAESSDSDYSPEQESFATPSQPTHKFPTKEFPGYPDKDEPLPANITLRHVCMFFPHHIQKENLIPFIQAKWSGSRIGRLLPDTGMTGHGFLYNRIKRAKEELEASGDLKRLAARPRLMEDGSEEDDEAFLATLPRDHPAVNAREAEQDSIDSEMKAEDSHDPMEGAPESATETESARLGLGKPAISAPPNNAFDEHFRQVNQDLQTQRQLTKRVLEMHPVHRNVPAAILEQVVDRVVLQTLEVELKQYLSQNPGTSFPAQQSPVNRHLSFHYYRARASLAARNAGGPQPSDSQAMMMAMAYQRRFVREGIRKVTETLARKEAKVSV